MASTLNRFSSYPMVMSCMKSMYITRSCGISAVFVIECPRIRSCKDYAWLMVFCQFSAMTLVWYRFKISFNTACFASYRHMFSKQKLFSLFPQLTRCSFFQRSMLKNWLATIQNICCLDLRPSTWRMVLQICFSKGYRVYKQTNLIFNFVLSKPSCAQNVSD